MSRKIVKVEDIKRENRIRFDMGDLKELAKSIEEFGIIHPPVVDQNLVLIAGGRRLAACNEILKWEEIEVDIREDIDELTRRELELEENVQRKDLTWQEQVEAQKAIHELKQQKYGKAIKGHESEGWSIKDTAELSDRSIGSVSMDIKLAEALDQHPELASEKNKFQALRKLKKMEEDAILEELSRRNISPLDERVQLIHGDCVEELKKLPDKSVQLALTDPPWAIDMDTASQLAKNYGVEYKDEVEKALKDTEAACQEIFRILEDDAHLFIFFGISNYHRILQILEDAGFEVDPVPVIWDKGSGGSASKGLTMPNAYETIFHAWKGRRMLNSGRGNLFRDFPRVPSEERAHTAQKPVDFLQAIIELASDVGDTVLDPFGGSGSTAVAAALSGRKAIVMEESASIYARMCENVKTLLITEGAAK